MAFRNLVNSTEGCTVIKHLINAILIHYKQNPVGRCSERVFMCSGGLWGLRHPLFLLRWLLLIGREALQPGCDSAESYFGRCLSCERTRNERMLWFTRWSIERHRLHHPFLQILWRLGCPSPHPGYVHHLNQGRSLCWICPFCHSSCRHRITCNNGSPSWL